MERPKEIWWCKDLNYLTEIDLLLTKPFSRNGIIGCSKRGGICTRDNKPCDATRGTITWEVESIEKARKGAR